MLMNGFHLSYAFDDSGEHAELLLTDANDFVLLRLAVEVKMEDVGAWRKIFEGNFSAVVSQTRGHAASGEVGDKHFAGYAG